MENTSCEWVEILKANLSVKLILKSEKIAVRFVFWFHFSFTNQNCILAKQINTKISIYIKQIK